MPCELLNFGSETLELSVGHRRDIHGCYRWVDPPSTIRAISFRATIFPILTALPPRVVVEAVVAGANMSFPNPNPTLPSSQRAKEPKSISFSTRAVTWRDPRTPPGGELANQS